MQISHTQDNYTDAVIETSSAPSAVSWGAIFAGGAAAVTLTLILILLGTGLGLSIVSPWSNDGIDGKAFTLTTVLWATFMSLSASALGGYIAGRLRPRWVNAQIHEIPFRDITHGFLAWAVATLATATLFTSVTTAIVSGGAKAGASVIGGITSTAGLVGSATLGAAAASGQDQRSLGSDKSLPYFLDALFRRDPALSVTQPDEIGSGVASQEITQFKTEITNIYLKAMADGSLSTEDLNYASQLVSRATGLPQAEAEKRINDSFSALQMKLKNAEETAREAVDKARKASAYGSLWLFISLVLGALVSSMAAVYGGRHRDR